jgi:hypothetical protein
MDIHNEVMDDVTLENDDGKRTYNLRSKKLYEPHDHTWEYGLHNMNVNSAIKQYGEIAIESVKNEIKQAIEKKIWHPVTKEYMNRHRSKVIRSFMFVKQKYTSQGKIDKLKSRLVAGGNMQNRDLYPNVSSKTVSLPAIFMIKECRM